jgi:hypothetical protein
MTKPFHYRDWLDILWAAFALIIIFAAVVAVPLFVVLHSLTGR